MEDFHWREVRNMFSLNGSSGFKVGVHFCLLAIITVSFCSIFKNKESKSKLKIFS